VLVPVQDSRFNVREHVRTVAIPVACLAVALSVTGSARARAEADGGIFRVALAAGTFLAIDPALDNGFPPLLRPACGALVAYPDAQFPEGHRLAPSLASSLPAVSRNGRTYTFTVRKDARFSDGTPVTARSFVHAIDRILSPAMDSPAADELARSIVGGSAVLGGRAQRVAGMVAKGRTLTLKLTKRTPEMLELVSELCAVPPNLPIDPEGVRAPLPSAAPYYVSEYLPNQRLVLDRNRFYRGARPRHVSRIVADLAAAESSIADQIAAGTADWGFLTLPVISARGDELARRYGVNKAQFFVRATGFTRMFVLNTSRPLFRDNPKLRQAVNFAVDRAALTRELGPFVGSPTDQFLRYRNERIYPLQGSDLRKARALAKGNLRGGKAILYTRSSTVDVAQAQVLRANLAAIGLDVQIETFPGQLIFDKLASGQDDFDIGRIAWGNVNGPVEPTLLGIFDGRTIGKPGNTNWSYYNSPEFNRRLDSAGRLSGGDRYKAYGDLDVWVSRNEAPAIPVAFLNSITFVSARTGCVVLNPYLDLTAVCIK
jgi:peptide/nickel transport system substrate-binding protein